VRTVIYEKAGRIRLEREALYGSQWRLITRLSFTGIKQAVTGYPRLWKGEKIIYEAGCPPLWDQLSDDLVCEMPLPPSYCPAAKNFAFELS
jgi:hypothetical protein